MAPLCAHCCSLGILMVTHVAPEYAHACSVHLIPRLLASYGILQADRGENKAAFTRCRLSDFSPHLTSIKWNVHIQNLPFVTYLDLSTSTTSRVVPILQMVKNGPT